MALMPVDEALARIAEAIEPVDVKTVPLGEAHGRVLGEPVRARRTQPPANVSAMDGYAVRTADVAAVPATLRVVGEVPAGSAYAGALQPGEAVRIFTGAPVPGGADTIIIQEDTSRDGDSVVVRTSAAAGRHIRKAGIDFREGDAGLEAGTRLGAAEVSLLAAMNVTEIPVRRRPKIVFFANGDELVAPGEAPGPNQIVSSNGPGLAAFIGRRGAIPVDLGIVPDDEGKLREAARAAQAPGGADMLVTLGGASVGDHDLVQSALAREGLAVDFWRIAMRPGKPLMFGRLGAIPMLGLPGNPVSSLVCALLFLGPAIERFLGRPASHPATVEARLGRDLPENDRRRDYMRASFERASDGGLIATPFEVQDSSLLSRLAQADGLIVRPPNAPPAAAGSPVPVIPLKFQGL